MFNYTQAKTAYSCAITDSLFSAPDDYISTTVDRAFVPGGPTSINIPVPTLQDLIAEGNEEFEGVLTMTGSVPGVRLGARDTATATIQDDDSMTVVI